jgi:hypothetical protein
VLVIRCLMRLTAISDPDVCFHDPRIVPKHDSIELCSRQAEGLSNCSHQFPFKLLKDVGGADFDSDLFQYPEDSGVEGHAISRQAQFD